MKTPLERRRFRQCRLRAQVLITADDDGRQGVEEVGQHRHRLEDGDAGHRAGHHPEDVAGHDGVAAALVGLQVGEVKTGVGLRGQVRSLKLPLHRRVGRAGQRRTQSQAAADGGGRVPAVEVNRRRGWRIDHGHHGHRTGEDSDKVAGDEPVAAALVGLQVGKREGGGVLPGQVGAMKLPLEGRRRRAGDGGVEIERRTGHERRQHARRNDRAKGRVVIHHQGDGRAGENTDAVAGDEAVKPGLVRRHTEKTETTVILSRQGCAVELPLVRRGRRGGNRGTDRHGGPGGRGRLTVIEIEGTRGREVSHGQGNGRAGEHAYSVARDQPIQPRLVG